MLIALFFKAAIVYTDSKKLSRVKTKNRPALVCFFENLKFVIVLFFLHSFDCIFNNAFGWIYSSNKLEFFPLWRNIYFNNV